MSYNRIGGGYLLGDAPFSRLRSGLWYGMPAPVGDAAMTLGYLYCTPMPLPAGLTISQIGINVSGAASGAVVRLGIYRDDGGAGPGALEVDAGEVDASTTGAKALDIDHLIAEGDLYWLAALATGAAPTVFRVQGASYALGTDSLIGGYSTAYVRTGVSAGALPDPWGGTAGVSVTVAPLVKVKPQ